MELRKNNTRLDELLLQCLSEPDPMLAMPDRLFRKLLRKVSLILYSQKKRKGKT